MGKKTKSIIGRKRLSIKKLLIVLSVLICIMFVVSRSAYANITEIEIQLKQNLKDVARQNAAILESKIYTQYKLLISLKKELEGVTEDKIEDKLEHFEIFMEGLNLKRFAICFPGGTTYSTDGEVTNLSFREFYERGMEGKCYITGVLDDALTDEHVPVNVMTIPIFDDVGYVSGVFGMTYDTDVFNESLQIDSFGGQGHSCIINEDGEIMSAMQTDGFELSHNIIDELISIDVRNEQLTGNLKKLMEQKEEGSGSFYLSEKSYYYIVPVDLMDGSVTWYILTIIPNDVLSQRITPIQKNQYITVFIVLLLASVCALVLILYTKEQHEENLRLAYEDSVTKGANYAKFRLEMDKKYNRNGCLVAMDIANFNNISIVAGEEAENILVKETWSIITEILNKEELAAHTADDSFLLFLSGKDESKILQIINKISCAISEKTKNLGVYGICARFGMYWMSNKETLENAYSKAKIAREYAVADNEQNYAFYNEISRVKIQHEKQLEERFPIAIENEEFEVWYQPKYSATDCNIVGSEALVRWKKENGEMISPGEFIPLFERNGMIVQLDEYMFRNVCRQQKKRVEEGGIVYPVSINISRASLYCIDLHKRYKDIMLEYDIEPRYIQLEVTESAMEEKAEIGELLNKFRQMGIKILMDDFGTGYSSLATLSLQCFDTLKLDKTLIDHIGSKDGETMLYHIIRMGQQMGLHITAEGVEKEVQLKFLRDMKCDDIQGFYFSKPVPKNEYEEMINNL